jgi:pSer/pThr/pTyr-binding forkhead associated (FHA) protein
MEIILERADGDDGDPFVIETPQNLLIESEFLIGRASDCHVRIPEQFVSRHHCEVLVDELHRDVRVRDLGSQNGTYVNNRPVTGDCQLSDGDRLIVGYIPFDVHIPEHFDVA